MKKHRLATVSRSALAHVALGALSFVSLAPLARANVGDAFGFGSQSAALAGAGAAWGFGGFAAYANPAALPAAAVPERHLGFSYAFLHMSPRLTPIPSIDTDYRSTTGQLIGLSYRFPGERKLTAGIATYLPLDQLAFHDTGEALLPEYFLYRARTQRAQFEFAVAGQLAPGLTLGAGFHLSYSLTTNATVFLSTSASNPSSMRFAASIKPKLSPYLGLLWASAEQDFTAGTVLRLPSTANNTMNLKTAARVAPLVPLDFNFAATSALYYDPLIVEAGASWRHSRNARLILQLDFQNWSRYQVPALAVQSCTDLLDESCGVIVANSRNPDFRFRDVLLPRIAEEIQLGEAVLRVGYAYRTGIIGVPAPGSGNYLDPNQHILTLGVGVPWGDFRLDLHGAYHQLLTQHVQAGYDAGGKIYGGGLSLSLGI